MRNKSKQDQSAQTDMNEYERIRLLRVQENQAKLRELGVKKVANSLTSLVESQKTKKKKKNTLDNNARDVDYFGGDNEVDYQQHARSAQVSQKQHRSQYIAPMSMTRYANLAKQKRVTASNVSDMFVIDSNTTKKGKKNANPANNKPSRATPTMADLILGKKGIQRQGMKESGARRNLSLVDSDDDEVDAARYQEVEDGFEDDENENEGNDFMTLDDVPDVQDEDIEEMLYENNEDDIQGDSEDDIDDTDDELVEEQIEGLPSQKARELSITKKRGPTMMHGVQVRNFNHREAIICNEFGQPIGPVTEEKDIVGQLSRFLGTIARTYSHAPLTHTEWRKVPNKEKMWEFVLEKYILPDDAKKWVLSTIGHAWRGYKCRIKKKHFYRLKDNKTRWKNRPKNIPEKDFQQLLNFWNNKVVMKRCSLKKDARMSQKNMHTAGPKSFARIREEMINDDPNKEPPTLAQMFERTRKRTPGNKYIDTYDDTAKKIEQMKNYKPSEDGSTSVDPFLAIMGKDYDGHRRLYGKGVTNRLINKVSGNDTSYMLPREIMDSLRENVEKDHLLDMRKKLEEEHATKKAELEEDHARKKAELQEDHARNKAELEAMRNDIDKVVDAKMQKIIEKLPPSIAQFLM